MKGDLHPWLEWLSFCADYIGKCPPEATAGWPYSEAAANKSQRFMLCCSVPSFLALRQVDCGRETAWLEDETLYFLSSPSFSLEALISSQSSGPSASIFVLGAGGNPP